MDEFRLFLPPLPYAEWLPTRRTLQQVCQMIGKVRMAAHPKLNHWWHVTLYPHVQGLTTGAVPYEGGAFEILLDAMRHRLVLSRSDGREVIVPLEGQTIAGIHEALMEGLADLNIEVSILARPYEMGDLPGFAANTAPAPYDPEAVERFWKALLAIHGVFEGFRGAYLGKSTPVHLYWHSFDLALTRFSGRPGPPRGGSKADREAYSHEVISFGFWPGDETVPEPAFYSYTYPEPPGLAEEGLPAEARWVTIRGGAQAFLPYEAARTAADPAALIRAFLDAAYAAGARRAGWDVEAFTRRDAP